MPVIRLCLLALLAAIIAGCSSTPEYQPIEPDTSLLAPAQQALAKAQAANAEQFAPRALDSARQKLSLARDIIYLAASQGRKLNDAERARVRRLVHSAQLDARLAIVQAQALAAGAELQQLRQALRAPSALAGSAPATRASP